MRPPRAKRSLELHNHDLHKEDAIAPSFAHCIYNYKNLQFPHGTAGIWGLGIAQNPIHNSQWAPERNRSQNVDILLVTFLFNKKRDSFN